MTRFATLTEVRYINWATDRTAECITQKPRRITGRSCTPGAFSVSQRVKVTLIQVVLKHAAVKLIAAALGDIVDDRTKIAAVLRRIVVRNDLDFLNSLGVANKKIGSSDAE